LEEETVNPLEAQKNPFITTFLDKGAQR